MQPRLVISQGDFGGIGPEVVLKSLSQGRVREQCRPLIVGHLEALQELANDLALDIGLRAVESAEIGFSVESMDSIPVLELETLPSSKTPGAPAASFGMAAVEAVLRAGDLCREGAADGMVTAPIHKESMHLAGYAFEGQTQILGELSQSRRYGMLACNGSLKILVATRHMSLRNALSKLDVNLVVKQIRIAHDAATNALGLLSPRIAIAGLNPHAGEAGAFGNEELKILAPGIDRAREEFGIEVAGPCVPDVVFSEGSRGKWDVVVALYHDQAFIPLKLLGREKAWTLLVGAPGLLRTSPMHGAAYDIARTGLADESPFIYTLQRTIEIIKSRASHSFA